MHWENWRIVHLSTMLMTYPTSLQKVHWGLCNNTHMYIVIQCSIKGVAPCITYSLLELVAVNFFCKVLVTFQSVDETLDCKYLPGNPLIIAVSVLVMQAVVLCLWAKRLFSHWSSLFQINTLFNNLLHQPSRMLGSYLCWTSILSIPYHLTPRYLYKKEFLF